jgi:malate dehydrogenase
VNIAVIGAAGDVGRQIAQQIVSERLLDRSERLVLAGNAQGGSSRSVYGLAADLTDAYAETRPVIEVVLDPERIRGDLIVIAAGRTPKPAPGGPMNRDSLARENADVFHHYASAIARHGHGHEIVVCISNPVELAVAIFSQHLGRHRVVGMGAFLDSLRFRQEIAADLGIRRQRIHAFVCGEHGSMFVPLWSGVHIYGYSRDALAKALQKIRLGVGTNEVWDVVAQAQAETVSLIAAGKVHDAYAELERYPPDVRVVTRPFVTHYSGAKTVIGTARATMDFLRTITQGADALVSGQISLNGEVYGIRGAVGIPFVVGNRGVDRVFEIPMDEDERRLLSESAQRCNTKMAPFLGRSDAN